MAKAAMTKSHFGSTKLRSSSINACDENDVLERAVPFIRDRLYFVTRRPKPNSTPAVHYFSVDDLFVYVNYNEDFGPLNLAMLTKYCRKINRKLKLPTLTNKKIVHVTGTDQKKRVNAAFLIAAYGILYLNKSPVEAYHLVDSEHLRAGFGRGSSNNRAAIRDFLPFRDASVAKSSYDLRLLDVLQALKRAVDSGFYNPETFDVSEYERREQVEHGDSNWIIPGKLLGFCGPHPRARVDTSGFPFHSPESYFDYFRSRGVKAVVRLNLPTYEGRRFAVAGFAHHDLFFPDGTTPSTNIVNKFLSICEKTDGAVAVHCKAGLGRTGTLIACYLMKHHRFSAPEAMGWIRVCRPGSVIGTQQNWLLDVEAEMWRRGAEEAKNKIVDGEEGNNTTTHVSAATGRESSKPTAKTQPSTGFSECEIVDDDSAAEGDREEAESCDDRTDSLSEGKAAVADVEAGTNTKAAEESSGKGTERTKGDDVENEPRCSDLPKEVALPDANPGVLPRRQCWVSDDPNKEEGETISQGDLLNRRKMAMKRNALVQAAGRSSSASSTSKATTPPPTTTTTTTPTSTTTPTIVPPPALQRRSSGRFDGRSRHSSDNYFEKSRIESASPSSAPTSPVAKTRSSSPGTPNWQSERNDGRKTPPSRCHPCGGVGYSGIGSRGYLTRASALNDNVGQREGVAVDGKRGHRSPGNGARVEEGSKEN